MTIRSGVMLCLVMAVSASAGRRAQVLPHLWNQSVSLYGRNPRGFGRPPAWFLFALTRYLVYDDGLSWESNSGRSIDIEK